MVEGVTHDSEDACHEDAYEPEARWLAPSLGPCFQLLYCTVLRGETGAADRRG
jgi:hypothetical protein